MFKKADGKIFYISDVLMHLFPRYGETSFPDDDKDLAEHITYYLDHEVNTVNDRLSDYDVIVENNAKLHSLHGEPPSRECLTPKVGD